MSDKIIGLDLLSNPSKTKKFSKGVVLSKSTEKPKKKKPTDIEAEFKLYMHELIDNFNHPLKTHEKTDPIRIQLESCFYFFNKKFLKTD